MATVWNWYRRYEAHVPTKNLASREVWELVQALGVLSAQVEMTEHGMYFECFEDYLSRHNESGEEGLEYSLRTGHWYDEANPPGFDESKTNALLTRLIADSSVSLVFVEYSYDDSHGSSRYEGTPRPVPTGKKWQRRVRGCPTLVLREVLAKRLGLSHEEVMQMVSRR